MLKCFKNKILSMRYKNYVLLLCLDFFFMCSYYWCSIFTHFSTLWTFSFNLSFTYFSPSITDLSSSSFTSALLFLVSFAISSFLLSYLDCHSFCEIEHKCCMVIDSMNKERIIKAFKWKYNWSKIFLLLLRMFH